VARAEEDISLRGFLRDFRWITLGFLVLWLLLFALDVGGIRTDLGVGEAALAGILCLVLIGPAAWLRHCQLDHARTGRFWAAMGLAFVWLIGGAVAVGVLLDDVLLD
jgi:hypothetical protein